MSKEKVLTVWNNEGINEEEFLVLRKPCVDIAAPFDDTRKRDIKKLIDAFLALDEAVGLAAPQIGISKRIIIFRNKEFKEKNWSKSDSDFDVLINPRVTQTRGELVTMAEGCLSCPEIQVEVGRFPEIKVRAYDQSGRKISKRYTDYLARVVQHEIDHLEGRLIIDYEGAMYIPKERQDFFARIFKQNETVTDDTTAGKL
jgi:peptide deformylase